MPDMGVGTIKSVEKTARLMLGDNEERSRTIATETGQLLYDLDLATGEILWFGAVEKITGHSPEEFAGVNLAGWEELIHPDDREVALYPLKEVRSKGSSYHAIYRFRHKDGAFLYVEDDGVPLKDDNGQICRLVGIMKDATERMKGEEIIRSLNRQIEFILGATKTGLDIIDSDFNLRYIDPEWQKVYGDPTGRKCYEYFMGRNDMSPVAVFLGQWKPRNQLSRKRFWPEKAAGLSR